NTQNAAQCVPAGQCAAGTRQTAPATSTMNATCVACVVGWYCPGGTNPGGACPSGSWDNDMSPASACAPWSNCTAGHFVSTSAPGPATADRQCSDCAPGTFSATTNASACAAFTPCASGSYISVPGTATSDNTCAPYTTCNPGQFVTAAGTASTDRM